jgi:hypothetical protein
MKFTGKFKGCVKETLVSTKGSREIEYKAILTIKSVNCSNKTAYLITTLDDDGEISSLAYLEHSKNPILRSVIPNGKGITSTYFDGKYLIHEVSMVVPNCKYNTLKVKYFKLKMCEDK